ncbi:hypothetical protein [Desulfatibacillum alkenivorans]|uniref:hypothetical protein n=1 Tax=Desulfatibacillum alkenivorans TaxID=259354 RepID=UPI001FCD5DC6|nr:hypothetical protein [Desulfatibacillum alkenivorans]
MQGVSQIAGHFIEQFPLLIVAGVFHRHGGGQYAVGHAAEMQPPGKTGQLVISGGQGTVRAMFSRIAGDDDFIPFQGVFHTGREIAGLHLIFHGFKAAFETRFRSCADGFFRRQAKGPPRLSPKQCDPGIQIAHGICQIDAGERDKILRVVFGHDKLIDVSDAEQNAVNVSKPLLLDAKLF